MEYHRLIQKGRQRDASIVQRERSQMGINDSMGPVAEQLQAAGFFEQEVKYHLAAGPAGELPPGIIDAPMDNGVPPAAPTNVVTTAFQREVGLVWDTPPPADWVVSSIITATPQVGGASRVVRGFSGHGTVNGIEAEPYDFTVKLVDRWGRESAPSATVTNTALATVADRIDFAQAEVLGELGFANIEELNDPDKIGDNVVTARAMAAGNAAFMTAWIEEAAIKKGMVESLSVDQLDTGTLTATDFYLSASGKILAGATVFDAGGVTLPVEGSFLAPTINRDYKIGVEEDFAALSFFEDAVANTRGAAVRADGLAGGRRSAIAFHATQDGTLSPTTTGWLEVRSGGDVGLGANGYVWMRPRLAIDGDLLMPSPNGTLWRISLDNQGFLTTTNLSSGAGGGGTIPQSQIFPTTQAGDNRTAWGSRSAYPPNYGGHLAVGQSLQAKREFSNQFYEVWVPLLRWDTSGLPDNAIITGAVLRLNITSITDSGGRSLVADWYPWNVTASDFTVLAPDSALAAVPVSTLVAGTNDFILRNFETNVSKIGITSLRLGITPAVESTFDTVIDFVSYSANPAVAPQLIVYYKTA